MSANDWIFEYFVSIGFYTLTEFSTVEIRKGPFDEACKWWPVKDLPPLMFDHSQIVSEALLALKVHIAHNPIGYELVADKIHPARNSCAL